MKLILTVILLIVNCANCTLPIYDCQYYLNGLCVGDDGEVSNIVDINSEQFKMSLTETMKAIEEEFNKRIWYVNDVERKKLDIEKVFGASNAKLYLVSWKYEVEDGDYRDGVTEDSHRMYVYAKKSCYKIHEIVAHEMYHVLTDNYLRFDPPDDENHDVPGVFLPSKDNDWSYQLSVEYQIYVSLAERFVWDEADDLSCLGVL